MFAFVKTARWDRVAGDAREAFAELTERLGDRVEEIELSSGVEAALDWHRTIMEVELAANLTREWNEGRAHLSARSGHGSSAAARRAPSTIWLPSPTCRAPRGIRRALLPAL